MSSPSKVIITAVYSFITLIQIISRELRVFNSSRLHTVMSCMAISTGFSFHSRLGHLDLRLHKLRLCAAPIAADYLQQIMQEQSHLLVE